MYCTNAPCGDASMELCMAAQEDPRPWKVPIDSSGTLNDAEFSSERMLDGRAHFSILGAVRRKPSRADAEATLSKSCSDKLAVKQVTSLLSFPTSLLIAPTLNAYLAGLILPEDELNRVACDRAFGSGPTGRLRQMDRINSRSCHSGYSLRPFQVLELPTKIFEELWAFRKPKSRDIQAKPSNISAVWTASSESHPSQRWSGTPNSVSLQTNINETLINGVKQGYSINSPQPKKASSLSRARMWSLLRDVIQLLPGADDFGKPMEACEEKGYYYNERLENDKMALFHDRYAELYQCVFSTSYGDLKRRAAAIVPAKTRQSAGQDVKNKLGNWIENRGDESWSVDVLGVNKT